jgi:hypothetical protein
VGWTRHQAVSHRYVCDVGVLTACKGVNTRSTEVLCRLLPCPFEGMQQLQPHQHQLHRNACSMALSVPANACAPIYCLDYVLPAALCISLLLLLLQFPEWQGFDRVHPIRSWAVGWPDGPHKY